MLSTFVAVAISAIYCWESSNAPLRVLDLTQMLNERVNTDSLIWIGTRRVAQAAEVQSFRKVAEMNRCASEGAPCFTFKKTGEMFFYGEHDDVDCYFTMILDCR
jgi:hypothetical protein